MSKALHRKDTYDTWGGRAHQPCHATNPTGRGRFGYKRPGMAQRSFRSSSHQAVSVSRPRREGAPSEAWGRSSQSQVGAAAGEGGGCRAEPRNTPRTRQALEKEEGNQMFACTSSRNFRNSFKSVPSTSSLSQAAMGRVGSTQGKITCWWPWRAEGDGGTVLGSLCGQQRLPGSGHGGFPGAAPTLRHPTAPGPPVCPFPKPNLGAKENKDDPNTGIHPAPSTTQRCFSPAKQRLLHNFPLGAAIAPHQLSWMEQVQITFRLFQEGQLFTDCLSLQFLTQMKHAGPYA